MLGKNKKMYWVDCIYAIVLCGMIWLVNYADAKHGYPNERVVRSAELTQAWSYMSGSKSHLEEQWMGYFVDRKTKAGFEHPISGGVYQTYMSGKRGIIYDINVARYKFDPDVNNTPWWFVTVIVSVVFTVIVGFLWFFWVMDRKKENTPHPDFR
jgi:hypothetical protein